MHILLGTVFIASLLGSLHCVGMCGPFALLAGRNSERGTSIAIPTIAYSCGRLVTYSIVGLVFGTLGMALNAGTSFAHWQRSATYVAGGLMIAVGLIALARLIGISVHLPKIFSPVQRILKIGFSAAKKMPPIRRALVIGMMTSLMPCGWLYTFAITAAGTGSPLWGVVVMMVFWAGTVPIMSALMLGFDRIGVSIQKRIPALMASLVIAIGVYTIVYRAPVVVGNEPHVVSGTQNLTEQIKGVDHESLPCCSASDKVEGDK